MCNQLTKQLDMYNFPNFRRADESLLQVLINSLG